MRKFKNSCDETILQNESNSELELFGQVATKSKTPEVLQVDVFLESGM